MVQTNRRRREKEEELKVIRHACLVGLNGMDLGHEGKNLRMMSRFYNLKY